jgi:putative membrane protein
MRTALALSVAAIAGSVLLGACSSRESESAAMPASPAPTPQIDPAGYVQGAGMSGLFEVESSQVATRRARNADVRRFARAMVQDHTEANGKIRSAAAASHPPLQPPTTLDPERQEDLAALRSASRSEFDQLYMQGQVDGHQKALELQQSYAESGGDPGLRTLATEMTVMVRRHLEDAQTILADLH